jgi:hypothetical protein
MQFIGAIINDENKLEVGGNFVEVDAKSITVA